jgi:hypothetical protein
MKTLDESTPQDGQLILAETKDSGIVHGRAKIQGDGTPVVHFDFYSGTAADFIIRWEPREPPAEPSGHPWCGIADGKI